MSLDDRGRVPIRSYRVVFRLERRLVKIDRWRLPFPYGIEVRALIYGAVVYLAMLVLSRLPLSGALLGLLPAPLHWGLLPLGISFALTKLRIDGRAPHRVLVAALRWAFAPRHLAGLRPCPPAGFTFAPLGDVWFRPDWRAPRYRRALITGPANVTLRYPATVQATRSARQRLRGGEVGIGRGEIAAARLVVHADAPRPMFTGRTIHIPRGGRVVFR
jgi:hypothetical protein